jgi:hypothetical protein
MDPAGAGSLIGVGGGGSCKLMLEQTKRLDMSDAKRVPFMRAEMSLKSKEDCWSVVLEPWMVFALSVLTLRRSFFR